MALHKHLNTYAINSGDLYNNFQPRADLLGVQTLKFYFLTRIKVYIVSGKFNFDWLFQYRRIANRINVTLQRGKLTLSSEILTG